MHVGASYHSDSGHADAEPTTSTTTITTTSKEEKRRERRTAVIRTQTITRPDSTSTVTWTLGNDGHADAFATPAISGSGLQNEPDGGGGVSGPGDESFLSANVVGVALSIVVVVLVLAAAMWYLCCRGMGWGLTLSVSYRTALLHKGQIDR